MAVMPARLKAQGGRMLKKHSQFLQNLLFLFDLSVICAAWLVAYGLRFSGWPIPVYYGTPPLQEFLFVLLFVPLVWGVIFKQMHMYRPRRISSHLAEVRDVLKAVTLATLILMVSSYLLKRLEISRLVFVYFWGLSSVGLIFTRLIFRELLRFARRRGYNLRHIVILGTEQLGRSLRQQIRQHPELGLNIVGFLTCHGYEVGQRVDGIEVIGPIDQVQSIVRARHIDQVFIALPLEAMAVLEKILQQLSHEMVDIHIVPDLYQYLVFQGSVEEFAGLPIVTLNGSPMFGWNSVLKRTVDLCVSMPLLLCSVPLFGLIAVLIKATSRGPVFYVQRRMGYDGRTFRMVKFRTMHTDAERHTGAVWAQAHDPRRTRVGAVLRRASVDELPQLWNVLKGEMSLVGPRPERPELVEEFGRHIPRYMLRHRVKAGMTGWAQVQGWRGNTSLEKRLEHDLYYIQHWSLLFDLKILWLTLWRGFVHTNAY
jgi:Undecaprenyl-phosphate glucose phosphotransferase